MGAVTCRAARRLDPSARAAAGGREPVAQVARRVAQTKLLVIAHCGHSPHRDQPELLMREAGAFIAART